MELGRRRLLVSIGVGAATAVAGCGDTGPGRTSTAMYVTNETDESQHVTFRVFDLPDEDGDADDETDTSENSDDAAEDGEQLFARRVRIDPEANTVVDGDELPAGRVRVRVFVRDGPEDSVDWNRIDEFATLDVRIAARTIRFTELD